MSELSIVYIDETNQYSQPRIDKYILNRYGGRLYEKIETYLCISICGMLKFRISKEAIYTQEDSYRFL
jgi:hypothetical protein